MEDAKEQLNLLSFDSLKANVTRVDYCRDFPGTSGRNSTPDSHREFPTLSIQRRADTKNFFVIRNFFR
jgi:hypothetical protein